MSHATSGSSRRPAHVLTGQGLSFHLATEVDALRRDVTWTSGGRASKTLGKVGELRSTLVLLRGGTRLEPQAAAGAATLQVLEGAITIQLDGEQQRAAAGDLLLMSDNLQEPILAASDAAFLLTIGWPEGAGASNDPEWKASAEETKA
jgi:quercetin dioxygenase-like cupin family protein